MASKQRLHDIRADNTRRTEEDEGKRIIEELLDHIDDQASRTARLQRTLDHLTSNNDFLNVI